jgi:EmrB/QacA subfamily drug resistance transporter
METTTAHLAIPNARRWVALAVLCTAQFMVIMDTSIIGVALPAIQKDLGYSASSLQWIFNAYVIFLGGLLLLGGKLSDLFGPRKVFMAGFGVLTAASLLAGLAWSETSMNVGRALQGVGSALIAPAALTLLMTIFTDPKEVGRALGFWGASAAAGGSAGVFLGGVLTEYLSWHWTFFINIPLGIIVLLVSRSYLIKGFTQKGKLDLTGALIATTALVLLVYGIVSLEMSGWTSLKVWSIIGASIALFMFFINMQKRSGNPILPMSIFKVHNLSIGNLVMMLLAAAWIPLWFYLNIYLQQVLKLSAFHSGLALLPMTLVIMIMMTNVTGRVIQKLGVKGTLALGLIFLTASLILFAQVSTGGNYMSEVLPASILGAIGMSLAYIPGTITSMAAAKPEETGLASGMVNTSYQVGSALGLAVIVAISAGFMRDAENITTFNNGIRFAFISAAAISAIAFIVTLLKVKKTG